MTSTSTQPTPREGSCLCGNVKYTVSGKPFVTAVCHCTNCQKNSGSAFAANAMFKQDQFQLVSGADSIKDFIDDKVDSGNVLKRSFCTNCGSSLYSENTTMPQMKDVVIVMTGCLDGDKTGFTPKRELYDHRRYACLSVEKGNARL